LSQFSALLETRSLHFTRADLLPDHFVDHINDATLKATPGMTANSARGAVGLMRIARQAVFVNCWYASRFDAPEIWEKYGGVNNSVAIKSSIASLRRTLEPASQKVYLSNVSYIDYGSEPLPLGNAFLSALHKEKQFQSEREVRALFLEARREEETFIPGPEGGIDVQIEVGSLIEDVEVAPGSNVEFRTRVENMRERRGG
jgi:hypothetical protein